MRRTATPGKEAASGELYSFLSTVNPETLDKRSAAGVINDGKVLINKIVRSIK